MVLLTKKEEQARKLSEMLLLLAMPWEKRRNPNEWLSKMARLVYLSSLVLRLEWCGCTATSAPPLVTSAWTVDWGPIHETLAQHRPNHHPAAHMWVWQMTSVVSFGAAENTSGFRGSPATGSDWTRLPSSLLLLRCIGLHWMVQRLHVGVTCREEYL